MLKQSNVILLVGLFLFYSPSHTKEISKDPEHISSNIEEIKEEMVNLNSSLNLLSITISNLVPR
tara:strand:+ start:1303 stop:1494 length:192 start_codon:yes stop_codon:yes gene_type:complete